MRSCVDSVQYLIRSCERLIWATLLWAVAPGPEPASARWEGKPCPRWASPPVPSSGRGELPLPKSLIKCAFVSSLQSFYWAWFVCPEFVMEFEGRRGQWTSFWVETILLCSKLKACVSGGLWENTEEVGEASVLCPCFAHRPITRVSSPGTVFLRNCCFSQGNPDARRTDEATSSPVKHGEEKPVPREPQKTLGQAGQRHRDEEGGSSTRHGRCWVR